MLHILNGDATGDAFGRAGLPGEVLVWRDMLSEGPSPDGLRHGSAWRIRAQVLARDFGIPADQYLAQASTALARLRAAPDHREVVLWFNDDLFCQANVWFLLRHLAPGVAASVPEAAPAHFGAHTPRHVFQQQFWHRRRLTAPERAWGSRAWDAYAQPHAPALQTMADEGHAPALQAHLARFPWRSTGLGAVDNAILRALRRTPRAFPELFQLVSAEALPRLGLGDVQVRSRLRRLASEPAPLVEQRRRAGTVTYRATPLGRKVLKGQANAVRLRPLDEWLGGIHLGGPGPVWVWDPQASRLVPAA